MALRMTKKRKSILSVLQSHKGTLTAKDVHTKLPSVDLATVYRNLDAFVKEKFITKVHLDTEEAHYEYQKEPHHHAVCSKCDKVIHFTAPDKKLKSALGLKNFEVDSIEVTVRGICTNNRKKIIK